MNNYTSQRWNSQRNVNTTNLFHSQPPQHNPIHPSYAFSQRTLPQITNPANQTANVTIMNLQNARIRVMESIKRLTGDQLRLAKIKRDQLTRQIEEIRRNDLNRSCPPQQPPTNNYQSNRGITNKGSFGYSSINVLPQQNTGLSLPVQKSVKEVNQFAVSQNGFGGKSIRENSKTKYTSWVNTTSFRNIDYNKFKQPEIVVESPLEEEEKEHEHSYKLVTDKNILVCFNCDHRLTETQAFMQRMSSSNPHQLTEKEKERFTESLNHVIHDPEFTLDNYETYVDDEGYKHIRYVVKRNIYGRDTEKVEEKPLSQLEEKVNKEIKEESIREEEKEITIGDLQSMGERNTGFQQKPIEHITHDKNGNPVKVYTTIDENGQPLQIINIIQNEVEVQYVSYIDEFGKQKVKLLKEFLEEQDEEERETESINNQNQLQQISRSPTENNDANINIRIRSESNREETVVEKTEDVSIIKNNDNNKDKGVKKELTADFISFVERQRPKTTFKENNTRNVERTKTETQERNDNSIDLIKQGKNIFQKSSNNTPVRTKENDKENSLIDNPLVYNQTTNLIEKSVDLLSGTKIVNTVSKTEDSLKQNKNELSSINNSDKYILVKNQMETEENEEENNKGNKIEVNKQIYPTDVIRNRAYSEINKRVLYQNQDTNMNRKTEHVVYNRNEVIRERNTVDNREVEMSDIENKQQPTPHRKRYHATEYQGKNNNPQIVRRELTERRIENNTQINNSKKDYSILNERTQDNKIREQRSQTYDNTVRYNIQSERRTVNDGIRRDQPVESMMNGLKVTRRSLSRTKTSQIGGGTFLKQKTPVKYETVGEKEEPIREKEKEEMIPLNYSKGDMISNDPIVFEERRVTESGEESIDSDTTFGERTFELPIRTNQI